MITAGLLTEIQVIDFLASTDYLANNLSFCTNYLNRCYTDNFKGYTYIHPFMLMPDYIIIQSENYDFLKVNLNDINHLISLGESLTNTWGPLEYTLKNYIINKNIPDTSAELIINTILFYYKNNCGIGFILSILKDNGVVANDLSDAQELVNLLVKLHNYSPNWILKGHSSKELSNLLDSSN